MFLDEQSFMALNGVPQYVSIRAQSEHAPLLLYLHGGPGDAALPLVATYNRELEQHFTVAIWEQRGAGKSYYPFDGPVKIEDFIRDLLVLTQSLLSRFHQPGLFLLAHSWGSVLGLRFVYQYPDYVRAYIGCGQVVNMKKSCQIAYDYALARASGRALARLKNIDCAYAGDHWLEDLLFVTRQVVKHKGSLYGRTNYHDFMPPFLRSKYYTVPDLIRRQKGSLQSIRALWQELMETNFEAQTRYHVPVLFVEGRYDSHVSSALAKHYFDTLETEKKFFWFENSCHFPQWTEYQRFNQLMIGLLETRML